MAYTIDDVRKLLADNESALRHCRLKAEKIGNCSASELDRVNARLAQMKPGQVARDPALAYEYQRLVEERGRLSLLAPS